MSEQKDSWLLGGAGLLIPPRRPPRVVLLRQDAPAERANPGRGSYELSEPVETGRTETALLHQPATRVTLNPPIGRMSADGNSDLRARMTNRGRRRQRPSDSVDPAANLPSTGSGTKRLSYNDFRHQIRRLTPSSRQPKLWRSAGTRRPCWLAVFAVPGRARTVPIGPQPSDHLVMLPQQGRGPPLLGFTHRPGSPRISTTCTSS